MWRGRVLLVLIVLLGLPTPLRRNGDGVAPERRWRCAGTAIPLRRNGHPVAPERPRVLLVPVVPIPSQPITINRVENVEWGMPPWCNGLGTGADLI